MIVNEQPQDTMPTENLQSEILQIELSKTKQKNLSKSPITVTHLHR